MPSQMRAMCIAVACELDITRQIFEKGYMNRGVRKEDWKEKGRLIL